MENLEVLKNKLEFGNVAQINAIKRLDEGEECNECENHVYINQNGEPIDDDCHAFDLYDDPFKDEYRIAYFCSEECLDRLFDTSWSDFRYFDCDECNRFVCEQSPSNGYHSQVRDLYDGEMRLCLKCYEAHILEHGVDEEEFEKGRLPGLFFSSDDIEPLEAGYSKVEGFVNYRVGDEKPVCEKALKLIANSYKVIVSYENMAIGGLEGYITLFAKRP